MRIPADLDRPDRILGGLTARQLAILAAGGVAAWTLVGLLEPSVGLPAAAVLAAPGGAGGDGVGVGLARRVAAGSPRGGRAGVVAAAQPAGGRPRRHPPSAGLGRSARPTGWRRSRGRSAAWIPPGWWIWAGRGGRWSVWPPRSTSACGPRAEQQALLASFARLLHALTGPMQVLVRSDRADLTPLLHTLRERAAALPDPGLEQAALAHARWLEALTGDRRGPPPPAAGRLPPARQHHHPRRGAASAGRAGRRAAGRRRCDPHPLGRRRRRPGPGRGHQP